jgi:O-antigen/teichoic acid export membrane protein
MWRGLLGDPLTRGWAVLTGAGIARLGLGLVASLVIARALGPAAYGTYAVLAATVGIVGALAEGGLTEAAVLRMAAVWPNAEARARAFFWLRLGLAAATIGLGCALAGPLAERVLNVDAGLLRWALLGIVATALSGATSGILQAAGAFGRMSWLVLANTGLTAVVALALALAGQLTLLSALVVLGIGTSLVTFGLGYRLLPHGWSLRFPSAALCRAEALRLFRTGRWLWIASLLAMLAVNLDVLVLHAWAALPIVGTYALALNLASKADLVNQSLYTVLLPRVGQVEPGAGLAAYARRGLLRSGLISLGLLALLPLAEPLIVLVYGPEFAPAAGLFRLLLGVVIFDVLTTPLLLLPLAYRQPRQMAAAEALRATTLALVAFGLVPAYGALGAVAARLAARVAGAALVLSLVWRDARDPARRSDPRLAARADRPA